jgi:hypothetical protein
VASLNAPRARVPTFPGTHGPVGLPPHHPRPPRSSRRSEHSAQQSTAQQQHWPKHAGTTCQDLDTAEGLQQLILYRNDW